MSRSAATARAFQPRSDDEIVAMAPVAIAFINGDLSLAELERRVSEARRT